MRTRTIQLFFYTLLILRASGEKKRKSASSLNAFSNALGGGAALTGQTCADNTRLMPDCKVCIPGLAVADDGLDGDDSSTKCILVDEETISLRNKLASFTKERYGKTGFQLYPYLSAPPLVRRQSDVGKMLGEDRPKSILEIGPYQNPAWKFFPLGYCPELVVALEPCGELVTGLTNQAWQSIVVPCESRSENGSSSHSSTHIIVAPVRAQQYFQSTHFHDTKFDAVICIGCDGTFGPKPEDLALIPRPFYLYMEYPDAYRPSVEKFKPESIADHICGNGTQPTRSKDYVNSPEDFGEVKYNEYALKRTLASYKCEQMVATMASGFKLDCLPSTISYEGMSCMSEAHSILTVRDPAFWPVAPDIEEMKELSRTARKRHNNCTVCEDILSSYRKLNKVVGVRTPFDATTAPAQTNVTIIDPFNFKSIAINVEDKGQTATLVELLAAAAAGHRHQEAAASLLLCLFPATILSAVIASWKRSTKGSKGSKGSARWKYSYQMVMILVFCVLLVKSILSLFNSSTFGWTNAPVASEPGSFSYLSSSSNSTSPLRVDDARYLLQYARSRYAEGGEISVWDALAATTVARRLLYGGEPYSMLMRKGGLLYEAIVDYNKYLAVLVDAAPQEYPSKYTYTLKECPRHMDKSYAELAIHSLEPILPDLRNHAFQELHLQADMSPYRVLASFSEVSSRKYGKKILLDVGTNGFMGSSKELLDMHAPFLKFDEVHLFEPRGQGMDVPDFYKGQSNITYHQLPITVGTRDDHDILVFLKENTTPEDYVVLKFDVDSGITGLTMEWGFLADLVHAKEMALVDELFIELHFAYHACQNGMGWFHHSHSMQQAYDVMRQLRQCGLAIHAWP